MIIYEFFNEVWTFTSPFKLSRIYPKDEKLKIYNASVFKSSFENNYHPKLSISAVQNILLSSKLKSAMFIRDKSGRF
jgi:hypothetical protein